jgi:hypothetical protein
VDIQNDAAQRRKELAIEDAKAELEEIETDPNFEQADSFKVLKDKSGAEYDMMMTYVDTASGRNQYGTNMFYKMQVLLNPITGPSPIPEHIMSIVCSNE